MKFALADYEQALELAPADESIRSRIADIHCSNAAKLLTDGITAVQFVAVYFTYL